MRQIAVGWFFDDGIDGSHGLRDGGLLIFEVEGRGCGERGSGRKSLNLCPSLSK